MAVDDDQLVLRVIARLLRDGGFVLTPARTPSETVDAISRRRFDLVLLDVHLTPDNGAEGLALIGDMRAAGCAAPIIVLSGDGDFERAHEAAKLGASGYLLKDRFEDLPAFVDSILRGRLKSEPDSLSAAAATYLLTKGLSDWDVSLLEDLAADFEREKEVARRLGRSETSVRKQFQKIREKLGARSQADLARILGVLSCFSPVEGDEIW